MAKIKVLIADDHAIVRMGLASMLNAQKDIRAVGEAEDGKSAIEETLRTNPDVVLMDLMMPVLNGGKATEAILRERPQTRIILLTTFGTADDIAHALSLGAAGALTKGLASAELLTAIRRVAAGETVISPEIAKNIANSPPAKQLTAHQSQILQVIAKGLSNKEIADKLGIRGDTVQDQVKVILQKLGAANRAEAVAIALRKHLLKI